MSGGDVVGWRVSRRLGAYWSWVWFAPISPYPVAAFRVLFGLAMLGYVLHLAPHVEVLFSSRGVYVPFLLPDVAPGLVGAWLLYGLWVAVTVLVVVGYRTALTAPLLVGVFLYHWLLGLAMADAAYDRLILLVLVLMTLAETDRVWAVSAEGRVGPAGGGAAGAGDAAGIEAWPVRLIQLQLAALYFGSGLWKLVLEPWGSGEVLRMTLTGAWATPAAFGLVGLGWPGWVYDGLTWGVVGFELMMGPALFVPRLRRLAVALGVLFHLSIGVLLGIWGFAVVALPAYVLFWPEDEVRSAVAAVRRRVVGAW